MRLAAALVACAMVGSLAVTMGCTAESTDPAPARTMDVSDALAPRMRRYVDDAAYRRAALEASLVRRDNGYATLRLARYDDAHWGSLPELDLAVAPMREGPRPAPGDASFDRLAHEPVAWTDAALRDLGERAFFSYPVQIAPNLETAALSPDGGGVWRHEGRVGAVWARTPRGAVLSSFTCATCHASVDAGALVAGKNNAEIDLGRVMGDGTAGPRWGLGRVDVTADGAENPVAITDLRPIRFQRNLHRAATLRNDPIALAIRIETLIITSHGQTARPPRTIAAALATYLWSLAPTHARPSAGAGHEIFARECARCHAGEEASGEPIALATVGTDPSVGESTERGTGTYRVPSLRGVGDRRRLLASGDVEDVEALLAADRTTAGHRYGLSLSADDRTALLAYLRAL